MLKKYLWSLPACSLTKNELFHSYFSRILINSGVNIETKRKVHIDNDNSAEINIAAKNMVTHDDPELWLWGPNKLYAILIFHFFLIIFICHQYNQKTKVARFDNLNMIWDWIWAIPNWCAQNRCIDAEKSLYQLLQTSKDLFFRTPLSYCVFMFINFYFCWDIDFFLVSLSRVFLLLKRHYIGVFENPIAYSCMRSTRVNMFSANWGSLLHFDKNVVFFWWGRRKLLHSERWRTSQHLTPPQK